MSTIPLYSKYIYETVHELDFINSYIHNLYQNSYLKVSHEITVLTKLIKM